MTSSLGPSTNTSIQRLRPASSSIHSKYMHTMPSAAVIAQTQAQITQMPLPARYAWRVDTLAATMMARRPGPSLLCSPQLYIKTTQVRRNYDEYKHTYVAVRFPTALGMRVESHITLFHSRGHAPLINPRLKADVERRIAVSAAADGLQITGSKHLYKNEEPHRMILFIDQTSPFANCLYDQRARLVAHSLGVMNVNRPLLHFSIEWVYDRFPEEPFPPEEYIPLHDLPTAQRSEDIMEEMDETP